MGPASGLLGHVDPDLTRHCGRHERFPFGNQERGEREIGRDSIVGWGVNARENQMNRDSSF